jgi:hypothetical protein
MLILLSLGWPVKVHLLSSIHYTGEAKAQCFSFRYSYKITRWALMTRRQVWKLYACLGNIKTIALKSTLDRKTPLQMVQSTASSAH